VSAECRTQRHLFCAPGGSGEQEIGDIGTGDEKNEGNGAQEDPEITADVTREHILNGTETEDLLAALAFELVIFKRRGQRVELRSSLLHRSAWLDPRHDFKICAGADRLCHRCE